MRRFLKIAAVLVFSAFVIAFVFRLTEAGSLTPSAAPAGTMKTLTDIFAPLVSTGYDSSAVVASKSGNALQIAKCIMQKITGGTPCS